MPKTYKTYNVTIRATVTKDIIIEAENEVAAEEFAHESFTVEHTGPEDYNQETVGQIEEVDNE